MNAREEIRPNGGPQEDFLGTSADMAFFGGAAGGGKSYAALLDELHWYKDPDFGSIILRRESVDLTGPGSIWEESKKLYSRFGGHFVQSPVHSCRFPSGALVEFRHLQYDDDVFAHQGKQYSKITFEEVTHFTEKQFWYMWSRRRTGAKVRPYLRATCNPDPDSFVRKLVDWWIGPDGYPIPERSGVIRYFVRGSDDALEWFGTHAEALAKYRDPQRITSFTFILSRLKDNPKIDPEYRGALLALDKVNRERLLGDEDRGGNWNIKPAAGLYFKRPMFRVLEERPFERLVKRRIRCWDKAATRDTGSNDPDWTCGVLLAELHDGSYVIEHVEWLRGTPGEVEKLILDTAIGDGRRVAIALWQDPGAAGVADVERSRALLKGYRLHIVRAAENKVTYAGVWQSQAEGQNIAVVRCPGLERLLTQLEAFPTPNIHDDGVDTISLGFQIMFGGASMADQIAAYGKG